jgi:hypothetical protein
LQQNRRVVLITLPNHRALMAVTGTKPATYRSDLFRGQGVAAFGAPEPVAKDRPLAMDAVSIVLRDELHERGLARKHASLIVRGFFDRWAEAVSHADHDDQDVVFGVVELDPMIQVDNWVCAIGPMEKLADYLMSLPRPQRRVLFVHLRDVLSTIRGRAVKAKLDLSGRFFVPPDHPLLAQIKADWSNWRAKNKVTGPRAKLPEMERFYRQRVDELQG